MRPKHKKALIRIILSALIFGTAILLGGINGYVGIATLLTSYIIIGYDILFKAGRGILRGSMFDENFLMSLATVGAIIIGEYHEAVFVMLFYQVGELFQGIAVGKSRKSIASLMEIRPDSATVIRGGKTQIVDPSEVSVGEVIIINPSEKIPLDGIICEGCTSVDTRALTGESMPKDIGVGEAVISGCVNLSGVITVKVTKEYGESTVSKILELVELSSAYKSKSENFITRFARVYTPIVVICAALLALLPPLFLGMGDLNIWRDWVYRAMTFLVISCPCALVISVPLSFFGGIGGMSQAGILVKGSNYLEAITDCDIAVFDKTGTLTHGKFSVSKCKAFGMSDRELLDIAAAVESFSNHPIADALKRDGITASNGKEIAGLGVSATVDGKTVYAGNIRLMEKIGVNCDKVDGTAVHIAVDGVYAGHILLSDTIKDTAQNVVSDLKKCGIKQVVMLTGDKIAPANAVAKKLGIDKVYSELLPTDKVLMIEQLSKNSKVIYIGDGINDAPVLARADVGVAMGALGTDAAIEAADIVLMDDDLSKLTTAIKLSRFTRKIVLQNIIFTLTVKAAILVCGALGITGMWAAVFADVGVAVIAILNAMRTLKKV